MNAEAIVLYRSLFYKLYIYMSNYVRVNYTSLRISFIPYPLSQKTFAANLFSRYFFNYY
jgi:hypothetical protein